MTWVHGGFWGHCAQNISSRVSLMHSSEKCWCLYGLYFQMSICAWGPELWSRCLWDGRLVVGEGDRGERQHSEVACVKGLQLFTGPSLIIFTVLLRNRGFQSSAQLFSLYSRPALLWEETCLHCVKLAWDSDMHQQHLGDVFFQEPPYT